MALTQGRQMWTAAMPVQYSENKLYADFAKEASR